MKKVTLMFPGQGSQYIGMGKSLCSESSIAKKTFEEASDTLGFDLFKMCTEGSLEELTKTENAQPAILTASVAAFRVFMNEIGIQPLYCAGHSLGEISALTCTGAINFSDAVRIVRKRGELMRDAVIDGNTAMAAIDNAPIDLIKRECEQESLNGNTVVISNYNSPGQIVISGYKNPVERIMEKMKNVSSRVTPLKVSGPFHSPLMKMASEKLRDFLSEFQYKDFQYSVLSNVTALPYRGKEEIIDALTNQMVSPVQWEAIMRYLEQNGVQTCVEIGPKSVLKNITSKNSANIKGYSYDVNEDNEILRKSMSQDPIKRGNGTLLMTRALAIAVCTRNRNWNNEDYENGVVKPYRAIKNMVEILEMEKKEPSVEQIREAVQMLKNNFITKKVPADEQRDRFKELFDETELGHLFIDMKLV